MSEMIRTGRHERIDRFYADVVDEVQVMAEAGQQHDQSKMPPVVAAGVVGRFLARFSTPVRAY